MLARLLFISLAFSTLSRSGQDSYFFDSFYENTAKMQCRSNADLRLDSIITELYSIDDVTMDTMVTTSNRQLFEYEWDRPFHPSLISEISGDNEQSRSFYTYDDENNWISIRSESFDESVGEWIEDGTSSRIYEMGMLIEEEAFTLRPNGEVFLGFKFEYEYDMDGKLTLRRYYIYNNATAEFRLSRVNCYAYDSNGEIEKITSKRDEGPNAEIVAETRYDYENGDLLGFISYSWDDSTQDFVPVSSRCYTLDDEGNRLESIFKSFINDQWSSTNRTTFAYDDCGRRLKSDFFLWDTDQEEWVINSVSTYYYSGTSSLSELTKEYNLKVYPNPTSDDITFDLKHFSSGQTISIMDASGKKVYQENISDNQNINLSDWNNGWYFYQTIIDDSIYSGKFLKL